MREIAEYLQENYYSKYSSMPKHLIPDNESLTQALEAHAEKIIVVKKDETIRGVAVFLTLSDDTYKNLDHINIGEIEILKELLQENGDNIHFILLTADNSQVIREGIVFAKNLKPKSISWFNPNHTHLHRFNFN